MSDTSDNLERRIQLDAKVSVLEERTLETKQTVNRIESKLDSHVIEEMAAMHGVFNLKKDLASILSEFKEDINDSLDKKLELKLSAAMAPITKDIEKYKGLAGGALWVITALWAFVVMFKDLLFRIFM